MKKKSDQKQKDLDEKFKVIFESSPIAIELYNSAGLLLEVNSSCLDLYGLKDKAEVLNFSLFDNPNIAEERKQDLKNGKNIHYEAIFDFEKVKELNLYSTSKSGQIILDIHISSIKNDGIISSYLLQTQDVTEHKKADEELKLAKEIAEHANLAKSRFLSNMSHELRNPMNGIAGILEELLEDEHTQKQDEYLKIMENSTNSLKNILNDVLDLSKIESNSITIVHEPFDLYKLASDISSLMLPMLRKKEIKTKITYNVKNAIGDNINMLRGDEFHLRQIITNLYGNAVKFTDRGSISLNVSGRENRPGFIDCMISLTDTGIGIAPDMIEKVFGRFMQADSTIEKKYQGTGLGLSISKGLIELMGGEIHVESTLGAGTKFCCTLSLELVANNLSSFKEQLSAEESADNAHISVLIVEDDEINRMLMEIRLKKLNYQIDNAVNGREAVDKVVLCASQGKKYDLIIMDVNMPIMNGIDAMIELRIKNYLMPIVMLTGHAFKEQTDEFVRQGATDVLTKPCSKEELLAILKKYL